MGCALNQASLPASGGRFGRRLVDGLARRPGGLIGRLAYRNGPRAHEASFKAVLDTLGPLTGERALEIGCGPGVLLERVLAQDPAFAAGLDHSPDMLAMCMDRNRQAIATERLQLKLARRRRDPVAG